MEFFILGLLVATSFIILFKKIEKQKWNSLIVDALVSLGLMFLFAGSFIGLIVAVVAGLILSIYFYFFEPTWIKDLIDNANKPYKGLKWRSNSLKVFVVNKGL